MTHTQNRIVVVTLLAGASMTLHGSDLAASGSYVLRPPQPSLVDAERYETGKAVFQGRLNAGGPAPALLASQAARLHALQDRLPAKVKRSTDLVRLAGTISPPQLAALEYYLQVRFKVSL